ncbi:MAG TPA: HAD family hydrolase [Fimbriimonadaceae bacterium]|nr:HAD family hydrolase [Fimbriimonadaceae bacterium]
MLKAVFFDLDDTLCGYWDASKHGLREAFRRHPVEGRTVDEMVTAWGKAFRKFSPKVKDSDWYETYCREGGVTRTEQMRMTLHEVGVYDESHASRLSDAYGFERDRALKLFDDAQGVLETLKAKYPLGLITNGPADIQRQEIATLGIGHYFDWVFIEGEMGIGKPADVVFERAEQAAEASPSELAFIGNSYAHDVFPAIQRGWKSIWVRRPSDVAPSRSGPEDKPEDAPEPSATISELNELLSLLG